MERKWAMTRLAAGDYLLPANDMSTMYRLNKIEEDGSLEQQGEDGEWRQVIGQFWELRRMPMERFQTLLALSDHDYEPWRYSEEWSTIHGLLSSRRAAIDEALDDMHRRASAQAE